MVHFLSSDPFYSKYVHLPGASSQVLPQICYNPKFWPFFKDALGTLDGSHFASAPPQAQQPFCRNRKGFISQNCLFACSFDLLFVYAMTGREGSANDARVWADARSKNLFIPNGKYYLADAGYPSCKELLTLYQNVHYHLAEWGHAGARYELIS
jgi:DDE superfamily endonuclease